jgi:hypothetical protein
MPINSSRRKGLARKPSMPTLVAFALLLEPAADMPITIVLCCLVLLPRLLGELAVAPALALLAVALALALLLAPRLILRISSHRPHPSRCGIWGCKGVGKRVRKGVRKGSGMNDKHKDKWCM